jgi:hypothetical protein
VVCACLIKRVVSWISVQKPSARSERRRINKDDERSAQDPTPSIPRHGKTDVTYLTFVHMYTKLLSHVLCCAGGLCRHS